MPGPAGGRREPGDIDQVDRDEAHAVGAVAAPGPFPREFRPRSASLIGDTVLASIGERVVCDLRTARVAALKNVDLLQWVFRRARG